MIIANFTTNLPTATQQFDQNSIDSAIARSREPLHQSTIFNQSSCADLRHSRPKRSASSKSGSSAKLPEILSHQGLCGSSSFVIKSRLTSTISSSKVASRASNCCVVIVKPRSRCLYTIIAQALSSQPWAIGPFQVAWGRQSSVMKFKGHCATHHLNLRDSLMPRSQPLS
jgi:hypothetical protein